MNEWQWLAAYVHAVFTGKRVLELGGGNAPWIRPNIDTRAGENVDMVADLNAPLPIPDAACDGIFSKYAAEHVSWRNVPQLWVECHRILTPGGSLVLVLPNLLEQMRLGVELGDAGRWEFDNGMSSRVFGDLDYPENSHKCGWSPEAICRELRAAGFVQVYVMPFGALGTDMVLEARKGA